MASYNPSEISAKFSCELCNYNCSKQSEYDKHISTTKHIKRENASNNASDLAPKSPTKFKCECGKIYNHDSSYYRHRRKCAEQSSSNSNNMVFDKDLFFLLVKENSELKNVIMETKNYMIEQHQTTQNMMMEVIKNGTNNSNNNNTTHTNSHNKAFNLNFFLNETCKDAMNITDFVESIKLQLSDVEKVGELGYVEGISNIIVKNLKDLDVTQRPVHCTDKKRETMYIKDEDTWEKDEEQKKMHKLVRKVADKNARMVPKFKEAHPDCVKSASRYSDQYNKIIMEAMGGRGDNDFEKEEKIIKRVSKEVIVEKKDSD